jgi:cyclic nucleotide-binding protein
MGVTDDAVFQSVDDPNDVTVWHDFAAADAARAFVSSDALRSAMQRAGVQGEPETCSTTFRLGPKDPVVPGVALSTLQPEPEVGPDQVRFVQTVGGRAGFPAPRRVSGKPFFRIQSATAGTTLALTIHADGKSEHELAGASPFPRHWIYDHEGALVEKAGTIDFKTWYREAHGENTPWGDEDSEVFVTQAEGALERQVTRELMRGKAAPQRRTLDVDETLVEQGARENELFVLLDGVLVATVDGEEVAEIGPGAILGERALLEGGVRTATLGARTLPRRRHARGGDRSGGVGSDRHGAPPRRTELAPYKSPPTTPSRPRITASGCRPVLILRACHVEDQVEHLT